MTATTTGRFDGAVRAYLRDRPQATVVALGEGLDPAFWRLDNGRVRWLSVAEPATAALRRMLLPDGPRHRTLTGRPDSPHWPTAVAHPGHGVLVLLHPHPLYPAAEPSPGTPPAGPPPVALDAVRALCAAHFPAATLLH